MRGQGGRLVVRNSPTSSGALEHNPPTYLHQLPFATTVSLDPLFTYWERMVASGDPLGRALFTKLATYRDRHPAVRGLIQEPGQLSAHRSFVELLMAAVLPPAYGEREPAAAMVPFEYRSIYATPAFDRLFAHESGTISGTVKMDLRSYTDGRIISAYLHVMREVYDVDIPFDYPITFTTKDPVTHLERHFKIVPDLRFVLIKRQGRVPELSPSAKSDVLSNISDISRWISVIPPTSFEFYGLSLIRAYDVTEERMVAMLERDLVEKGSLVNRTTLPDIEDHLRTLLQMRHLELGLAAIDGNDFYLLNEPSQPLVDTFFTRSTRYNRSSLDGSLFELCLKDPHVRVIDDLQALDTPSEIEQDLLRWGVRNVVAIPLLAQDEHVGILYIWSPQPKALSGLNVIKLLEVVPIFSAAVMRSREEMRNRVQSVIMGKYTAIHPSVEWRFREAARNYIKMQEDGQPLEVEPIVFEDVYPLFAATDIRGSSEHRNEAVQYDLLEHLGLVHTLLEASLEVKRLAIIDHLLARTKQFISTLQEGISSGDEAAVRDFLHIDFDPILNNLNGIDGRLDADIQMYRRTIDSSSGVLYRHSRGFDESVRKINEVISGYLDAEQTKLQRLFPHYFEKHQTDGVDFTMYVGPTLLERGSMDAGWAHVLRLWQLMVMCGIAVRTNALRNQLDVPLETTHLVLVQNTPISIRYRFDESRFDVDGPNHVRFEIMKQRVEKARIRGASERLTQPDRIAIVYSQDREAQEYASYLEFLHARNVLNSDIESVQLDDLQGMKGLRAFRIGVSATTIEDLPAISPDLLQALVAEFM